MQTNKYAHLECERRWLVNAARAAELMREKPFHRRFEDRYLDGGRLRVRGIIESDSPQRTYKLTKKFGAEPGQPRQIVTMRLTLAEHDALKTLPGRDLTKTRVYEGFGDDMFSIDLFDGPLAGLATCEIEAEDPAALAAIEAPPFAAREVTTDPFFEGGNLCRVSREELLARLAEAGI